MPVIDVPKWCRWRSGGRPLLLVAPHGGHADTTTAPNARTKVNDVHTAELTWELATHLDAAAIVNPVIDRNRLDLNRISQVTHAAAWFPALIEHLLAQLLDAHHTVEVLVVHGWNVIQPKCDLGVGVHFEREDEAASFAQLTAAPDYIRERLYALRTRCTAAGVHMTYGERYPASHPNNLLQLFRCDGSCSYAGAPRIAEWAAGGRLNAVQIELGVPLRWPGPWRETFMQALIGTFGEAVSGAEATPAGQDANVAAAAVAARRSTGFRTGAYTPIARTSSTSLLAYDPRAGLGVMSSISAQSTGLLGGRLLIFLHGQTMALFTGEDPARQGAVIGGPRFGTRDDCMELHFAGPLLEVQDGAAYVRLEQAFRQSRLTEAHLALSFRRTHGNSYGRVQGTLRLDGVIHRIDTFGFRDVPIFLRRVGTASTRCAIAAAFGHDSGLHAATTDDDAMSWVVHGVDGTHTTQVPTSIQEARSGVSPAPAHLTIRTHQQRLLVTPLNHMQIHRPLPGGGEVVFLGLACCRLEAGNDGYGFYEYVRRALPEADALAQAGPG